jgi:uncharacterized membrane protein (UPF0127 family)
MLFRRFVLLGLCAAFASSASCAPRDGGPRGAGAPGDTQTLTIVSGGSEARFNVELADTDEERRIGLMYRTSMAENAGMLFDFSHENQVQSMWMKNTLIPLDMAFIAKDGRIVRIEKMTTPRSLTSIRSGEQVAAVLEVNGGRFDALGIKPGDTVRHPLFSGQ